MFKAVGYFRLIQGFQLALEVAGLRPVTVKHYVSDTKKFLAYHDDLTVEDITSIHIRRYLSYLRTRVSAKTVYEVQLALRKFFRFMFDEGELVSNPCEGIKLTRYRVDPQPIYTVEEIRELLHSCDLKTNTGIRDYAVITVLFDTGVRVGELISMGIPDWKNRLVTVNGKGGIRYIPLGLRSMQSIERYSRKWRINEYPLWQGKYGPLTTSGILQMVRNRCQEFRVPYKGVHAFRRSAAAHMKRMGMNDSDIMEILGWGEVTMLRRYVSSVAFELAQSAHSRFSPVDSVLSAKNP